LWEVPTGRIVRRPAYLENYALSAMTYSDDVSISYSTIEDIDGMKN
jgi:hypothetical protein